MNRTQQKTWNTRSFIALAMTFSGLCLPVTGYANHIYQFAPMSVARHAWMAAHNILAVQFAVFAVWHAILNRRAFAFSREAAYAGLAVALLSALFIGHAFHAKP
jgi:hypothetical protein